MTTTPVVLIHDGAIDELVCLPFLVSMAPAIELTAVWITPADCLAYPTAAASSQILNLVRKPSMPLYLSDSSSERPFPWEYRQYAMMVNLLPILNPTPAFPQLPITNVSFCSPGNGAVIAAFADSLKAASDAAGSPVKFLVTSPLTDLAGLLAAEPSIKELIGEVIWMGGTLGAGGNIDTGIAPGANPNAEWNAYWDPAAAHAVLASGVPFTMFPLDITNSTLLNPATLQQYFLPKAAGNTLMNLVSQLYALVAFQGGFSFWDTLTAAYLGNPSLFALHTQSLDIDTDPQSATFGQFNKTGFNINVCTAYASGQSADSFYPYLVGQLESVATV